MPELNSIENTFLEICDDDDGEINSIGLKKTLRLRSSLEAAGLLESMDNDGHGKLCFSEFLVATSSAEIFHCEATAKRAYDTLDSDGDGFVSATDLLEVLPHVFSEAELKTEMARYDLNGDGLIDFKEFCALLKEEVSDSKKAT